MNVLVFWFLVGEAGKLVMSLGLREKWYSPGGLVLGTPGVLGVQPMSTHLSEGGGRGYVRFGRLGGRYIGIWGRKVEFVFFSSDTSKKLSSWPTVPDNIDPLPFGLTWPRA